MHDKTYVLWTLSFSDKEIRPYLERKIPMHNLGIRYGSEEYNSIIDLLQRDFEK